jgi:pimeloyl-ACP methyl ester carboxylesterase
MVQSSMSAAMTSVAHRTATVASGDVTIFYRRFGAPGRTPIVILHGANYYDSADWIDVATRLATDREIIAFDARGYGRSTWSPSKDYSINANLGDVLAVLDHAGWDKAIVMGASRGGAFGLAFAGQFPQRTAGYVAVDFVPDIAVRHPGSPIQLTQTIGNKPRVFASIEEALERTSRDQNIPPGSTARKRFEEVLKKVEGGYILGYRDPDFWNPIPTVPGHWPTQLTFEIDLWKELAQLAVPVLFIKARASASGHDPGALDRIRREFPHAHVTEVDGGHDVAAGQPDQLLDRVRTFLAATAL